MFFVVWEIQKNNLPLIFVMTYFVWSISHRYKQFLLHKKIKYNFRFWSWKVKFNNYKRKRCISSLFIPNSTSTFSKFLFIKPGPYFFNLYLKSSLSFPKLLDLLVASSQWKVDVLYIISGNRKFEVSNLVRCYTNTLCYFTSYHNYYKKIYLQLIVNKSRYIL